MSRQPRLDYSGAVHHAIGRGIKRRNILGTEQHNQSFLERLSTYGGKTATEMGRQMQIGQAASSMARERGRRLVEEGDLEAVLLNDDQ